MIRIEHIEKKFKRVTALADVSANFSAGQVISLVGPNGSGKTTLIKCILGLVKPCNGRIFFGDKLITNEYHYRNEIGYMPQMGRYPDNMKMGHLFEMLKNIRCTETENMDNELIREFDLCTMFEKPMRTLSGGTRQKVSAAIAFLFNPKVLILDEPTAGLDPLASEILKQKILKEKNRDKLILITSHILSDLEELTTHVIYMQEGKLLFFKDMRTLQEETGEIRLGKVIASIMRGNDPARNLIQEIFHQNKENP